MRSFGEVLVVVALVLAGCSDDAGPEAAVTSTTIAAKTTTTRSSSTTTVQAATSSTTSSTAAPAAAIPPTTAAPDSGATRPDGPPPPPPPVTMAPPTTRSPHPVGNASVVCSGPSGGPYSVKVTWAFSDGVAERASGTYATYGTYTLAGNRADSFTVSVGPPALGTTVPYCVFLSITSPA